MTNENDKIKYFSMFSGVGGFELGFEGANDLSKTKRSQQKGSEKNSPNFKQELLAPKQFTCVGLSENNKYASELLKSKFPNIKNYGDATKINPRELPDFDILCGGFPCQAFSIAGKRRGFQDTRGTLFFEVVRIVKVKRPKIIFLENVKGLLNHEKGKTFSVIIKTLSELGYDVQWVVLNSKFFGVPQNRERVFIIGSLRGTSRPEILPFREINCLPYEKHGTENSTSQTLRSTYYKGGKGTHIRAIDVYNKKMRDEIPTLSDPCHNSIRIAVLTPNRENKRQNGRRFKESGDPSFTLTGQDIHGVLEQTEKGVAIRKLTPIECERLQGFPDNWTQDFSDTQRYKMMGNAVTVNVVREVANCLI